jgi:hypothetical protein
MVAGHIHALGRPLHWTALLAGEVWCCCVELRRLCVWCVCHRRQAWTLCVHLQLQMCFMARPAVEIHVCVYNEHRAQGVTAHSADVAAAVLLGGAGVGCTVSV